MLTYKQAYDKIIQAYFNNEIQPMSMQFCFCGTLSPDSMWKFKPLNEDHYPYSVDEYRRMENELFNGITNDYKSSEFTNMLVYKQVDHPLYEEQLFKGMCRALEELRKIHISRGEDVDSCPLVKRELKKEEIC